MVLGARNSAKQQAGCCQGRHQARSQFGHRTGGTNKGTVNCPTCHRSSDFWIGNRVMSRLTSHAFSILSVLTSFSLSLFLSLSLFPAYQVRADVPGPLEPCLLPEVQSHRPESTR